MQSGGGAKQQCVHCTMLIRVSNMARHVNLKHNHQEEEVPEDILDSDFEQGEAEREQEAEAPPPNFIVHPAAAAYGDTLRAFFAFQLESSPAGEAGTTAAVVQHYILYAQEQPREIIPLAEGVVVTQLDLLLLDVPLYASWLVSGSLANARFGTRLAYLNRFQRFLKWRISHPLGNLLDTRLSAVRVATCAVMAHLKEMKKAEQKRTRADQKARLCQEELEKRGQWCSVRELLRALRVNRPQFDATIAAARVSNGLKPSDRSFATGFVLSACSILVAPARVGECCNSLLLPICIVLTYCTL